MLETQTVAKRERSSLLTTVQRMPLAVARMYRGVLLPPADKGRLPEEGRERRDRFCAEYGRKRSIVLEEEMIESGNSVASV